MRGPVRERTAPPGGRSVAAARRLAGAASDQPHPGAAPQPEAGPHAEPMLMYLVKQVELAVRSRLDDIFRPIGLTALQYTALTVLERHPDLTTAQLARHSFVTAQSMADMVAALCDRGLTERHRDDADHRRLVISLTAGGQELLDTYRDAVRELEAQMLTGLTAAQVASLRRNMHTCHLNLTGGRPR